jgi:hypothetical protein
VAWFTAPNKGGEGEESRRPRANHGQVQASVEILGSTKQCLNLRVNPELLTAPPLRVTNAEALLGPPPPPQHFVEELLGGPANYNAVAAPEHVYAWLLGVVADGTDATTNRTALAPVAPATAAQLSRALTDFDSYEWLSTSDCGPAYAAAFRFVKGGNTVDVYWNPDCNHIQITSKGAPSGKDCEAIRGVLLRTLQSVYPADNTVKSLSQ